MDSESELITQLKNDYPDINIDLDIRKRIISAGGRGVLLMNSAEELASAKISTRSGRSFYQAVAQLLYSNFGIEPAEGSYADSLIVRKEDLDLFRIRRLSNEWGIGFLEGDGEILAVEITDPETEKILLEESLEISGDEGSPRDGDEEFGELEEIEDDLAYDYIAKGLEFLSELEGLEKPSVSTSSTREADLKEVPERENKKPGKSGNAFSAIRKLFGR